MEQFYTMSKSKQLIILAFAVLMAAGAFVWKKRDTAEKSALDDDGSIPTFATEPEHGNPRGVTGNSTVEKSTESKPLALPLGSLPMIEKEADAVEVQERNQRVIAENDAILAAGGVIEAKPKNPADEAVSRGNRLKSILAKDWESKANLLVNELRAGKGFEVGLDQVEAFLRGKDLYGWPEGQRNWIGDEMMTMLRQEMPAKAYEIFRDIQADASAPDAMRDYSIQHISHLVADGQVGQEGVSLIRAALESNNPVLASTALISLHRLSEKTPQWITPDTVTQQAKTYQNSTDERLKATAQAILKDAK